jgi:hypothetical protein
MAYPLQNDPHIPGTDYQSKYGTAPYEESRRKAESRFSLMNILTGALSGLSAGPGLNPFYSAGRGFAASYGRRSAAQRAAQEYAMKMQSQEQRQQEHADLEAVRKKPPPPPKDTPPEKDPRPWFYQPKHWNDPGAEAQRRKAEHIPTGKGPTAKGTSAKAPATPKPPKPMVIRRRVPTGKGLPTEQQIIDSIMESTDLNSLTPYVTGRGSADSESIRRAAQMRTGQILREGR